MPIVNTPSRQDDSLAFLKAAARGNFKYIEYWLANPQADINFQQPLDKFTVLHYAAMYNATTVIMLLLLAGAEVNIPDCNGNTPFMLAVQFRSFEAVSLFLMAADLCVYAMNNMYNKPLDILHGYRRDMARNPRINHSISQRLILNQIMQCIQAVEDTHKRSMEHRFLFAAQTGRQLTVKRYVKLNPPDKLNETNEFKCSALLLAAGSDQIAVVEILIDAGADVNQMDSTSITPLMAATLSNNIAIVRLLLNAKDTNGLYKISAESKQKAYEIAQDKGYVEIADAIRATMGMQTTPPHAANDSVITTTPHATLTSPSQHLHSWRFFSTEQDILAALSAINASPSQAIPPPFKP